MKDGEKSSVKRAKNGENRAEGRDANGRFGKGNSLGGRKAIAPDVKKMLQAAVPDAVQMLIDTMMDERIRPELRVRCAETIIERVHGKAAQPIEGDLAGGIIVTLGGELKDYAD